MRSATYFELERDDHEFARSIHLLDIAGPGVVPLMCVLRAARNVKPWTGCTADASVQLASRIT